MNRGRLIVFEGLDGCGKSTQAARLVAELGARGHDVLATREPTDGPVGRRIRELARRGELLPAEQELALFVEDRRQHVAEVIAPALAAGRLVVSDRYFLSSVAYQGARGLGWRAILEQSEAEHPLPDLALLLSVEVALGLRRVAERGAPAESLFESEARLTRVAAIFAQVERPYLVRIDASPGPDAVQRAVLDRVAPLLQAS